MKEFYTTTYGKNAKIPLDSFNLWADRAIAYLKLFCTVLPDSVAAKKCICEVAELLYSRDNKNGIESESNDGYSIKYSNGDTKNAVYNIAKLYLLSSGVMYRGDICDA